jgi:hypothetical protein
MQLANLIAPEAVKLVLFIRHKDGTATVVGTLNEADAGFDADIKQAMDYMATIPKKP